jgi:hypothetical protein
VGSERIQYALGVGFGDGVDLSEAVGGERFGALG